MKTLLLLSLFTSSIAMAGVDVDLLKSQITWEAKKVVAGGHHGEVKIKNISIEEKDGLLSKGKIVIDLKSADVTDLEGEWKDKFLVHVKSSDFFDVEKYPDAKLEITEVKGLKAKGILKIKDKSAEVSFDFKKNGKEYSGELVFDRTKFDIVYGSNNFFKNLGDKAIANDIKIGFKIVLK